ncbi:MAG: tetratricopeptide repeat protein [Planctomycetes bacterium]|nr:tetratricopeptide repeat protein [Planctomycetota bacterium]
MSSRVPIDRRAPIRHFCPDCARAGRETALAYVGATRWEEGPILGVARRCPHCGAVALETFAPRPGPRPDPGACLGCGASGVSLGETCPGCGLDPAGLAAALEREPAELAASGAAGARAWAHALIERGEVRGALFTLDLALAADPGDADAWETRIDLLRRVGFAEEALACLAVAAGAGGLEPRRAERARGLALAQLGRFPESLAALDRALAAAPGDAGARVDRGIVLRKLGRHGEAVAEYRRVLAREPDHLGAWYNLAAAEFEANRPAAAREAVDAALARAPELEPAVRLAGDVALELGEPERALACYDRALALLPPGAFDAALLLRRGMTLDKVGRLREGVECLRAILYACPGDRMVLDSLRCMEERLGAPAGCPGGAPAEGAGS